MACTKQVSCMLLLVGIAFAAPNLQENNSIDFSLTLAYSTPIKEDQRLLLPYLQAAARGLAREDVAAFKDVTLFIAKNLGQIFTAYKKLNETSQFRNFVELASNDLYFERNLEMALEETSFRNVEDLDRAITALNSGALSTDLSRSFNEVFVTLDEGKTLIRFVKEGLNKLLDNHRVLAARALRIVLLENVVKYVPQVSTTAYHPTVRSIVPYDHVHHYNTSFPDVNNMTHTSSGGADMLHKCVLLLAFAISSQFLF